MYRTIDAKFWTDPAIRLASPEAKLLALYLVTNPHSHVSGIYYLPRVLIAAETGIAHAKLGYPIDTLSECAFAHFDHAHEVVWVRNMFRYQGRGAKNAQCAAHQLDDLHNSPLVKEFEAVYPEVSEYRIDRVSIGYPKTPVPVPVPVLVSDPVSDPDPVAHAHSNAHAQNQNAQSRKRSEYSAEFGRFWDVFPAGRKTDKRRAWDAWQRQVGESEAEAVIGAADEYGRSPLGRGQFVKQPATWLNGRCWEDDRAAWQRSDGEPEHTRQTKAAVANVAKWWPDEVQEANA